MSIRTSTTACIGLLLTVLLYAADAAADPSILQDALKAACVGAPEDHAALTAAFPDGRMLEAKVTDFRGRPGRARHIVLLANGDEVRLTRMFPGGRLRRVTAEYHQQTANGALRPVLAAIAAGDCRAREGRRLAYGADGGGPAHLDVLAPDLAEKLSTEDLNPRVPKGRDPGGVAVAHIDTGVNYLLPFVAERLARRADGRLHGFDFWDMDARPFDLDTGRSAFFPRRHGTAVASIVLREAPDARLAPFRFPRPDMTRMGDVIRAADEAGAHIVNMAMGSNKPEDWKAFAEAAKARPHMLFVVSAGNNGRDIDARPVYPAALELENLLTVTSADAFGRLAHGSNWGRESVDVMVPGEQVAVIDHRGVDGQASGSSFAVPRLTALAARLAAKNPAWRAPELKRAILSRARPSPRQPDLPLKHGWIPDPTDDYLP